MPHHLLCDLWGNAGAGQLRAERGSQCVQIDFAAVLVGRDDACRGFRSRPGSDHDDVAGIIPDDLFACDSCPKKVMASRPVADHVRKHVSVTNDAMLDAALVKCFGELGMHRDHIHAVLRLTAPNRDRHRIEVHIGPLQPAQIATPQAGERRRHVPAMPVVLPCD
ncbi:MAG: hypothetical protein AAF432_15870 [Planctomycetota bacterium]